MFSQPKEVKPSEYKPVVLSLNSEEIESDKELKDAREQQYELKLEEVITSATLSAQDPNEQARKILDAFNQKRGSSAVTTSIVRGQRIGRDEFILAHRNEIPELVPFSTSLIARALTTPGNVTEIIRVVKQTEFFYGAHGSWVVNVPVGKYVKGWSSNGKPLLLSEGPHVLHDPTFKLEEKDAIVDKSSPYIVHGTKHIIRVPAGKLAKIWIGTEPYVLESRPEPYVFETPLFRLEKAENELFEDLSVPYIQHGPIHILRVPAGQMAMITINNQPRILESRSAPYKFRTPYFKLERPEQGGMFVDISTPYIKHGPINILRIPTGKIAKAWIGSKPLLIEAEGKKEFLKEFKELEEVSSGVFRCNSPLFRLERMSRDELYENASTPYIQHGIIHRLRIPAGKMAKIWEGTKPSLLESRSEPYEFSDPQFKLDRASRDELFEDAFTPYIQHGTQHILRVPAGKIAKVWFGAKPLLLDSNGLKDAKELNHIEEVSPGFYKCNSPFFKLDRAANGELFENASNKLIVHGSLKRIIPDTSEVAIAYDNGKLDVFGPDREGKPHFKDSPNYRVDGFLKTSIQTLVFPSDASKKQRREENKDTPPDEINYEVFNTKDSLKIGVKLLVAYEITNPEETLKKLGRLEDINKHIENVTTVDMGKVIQQRTSQDFLSFEHTTPKKVAASEEKNFDLLTSARPSELNSIQDKVMHELSKDLAEYGIKLVRLNFETPKILNTEIASKMAQQSLRTAGAVADKAVIDIDTEVAKKKADQTAAIKKIEQDQVNQSVISAAEAKSKAAAEEAKAILTKAQAEADAKLMLAKMEAEAIVLRAKAEKEAKELQADADGKAILRKGQAYRENPELLQAEVTQSGFASFKDSRPNINFTVVPESLGKFAMPGLTLFSQGGGLASLLAAPQQHVVRNSEEKESKLQARAS